MTVLHVIFFKFTFFSLPFLSIHFCEFLQTNLCGQDIEQSHNQTPLCTALYNTLPVPLSTTGLSISIVFL